MGAIVGGDWTYSGDPSTDDKDAVRWVIGDTDGSDQLASDQEIIWTLAREGDVYKAGAQVALSIGAGYSRKADLEVGDLKIAYGQRADKFMALSKALTVQYQESLTESAAPFNAAVSSGEKDATTQDTDRVAPAFRIGWSDYPGSDPNGSST